MKKNHFRYLFILFALPFLFSCKKNSSEKTPEYYVKFKMNGQWETYSAAVGELGPDLVDETKTNFNIVGSNDDNTKSLSAEFQVDGPQITTGVYDNDSYLTNVTYATTTPDFTSYVGGSFYDFEGSTYSINVTSITDKTLSGTFTGNYVVNFMNTSEKIEITEGEFKVLRIR